MSMTDWISSMISSKYGLINDFFSNLYHVRTSRDVILL